MNFLFTKGTNAICEILANLEDAITVIGGGDSAAAAIQAGYKEKFDHISTGGGASLMILEGKPLPGVEIIKNKHNLLGYVSYYKINNMLIRRVQVGQKSFYFNWTFSSNSSTGNNPCNCNSFCFYIIEKTK